MFKFFKSKLEKRQTSPYQSEILAKQLTLPTSISFREFESSVTTAIACIDLIQNSMMSLPVRLVRYGDISKEIVTNHPLNRVLANPCPPVCYGFSDVIKVTVRSLLASGNAVILIGGDDEVMTLEPIPWQYCGIVNLSTDDLTYQISRPYRGKAKTYSASRVIHLKLASDDGNFYGRSPAERAGMSVSLVTAIEKRTQGWVTNQCRPSLALMTSKTLSPETKEQARQQLMTDFSLDKIGRPMIIDQDIKLEQVKTTGKDEQWLEQRGLSMISVCQIYGVPPILAGDLLHGGTWSNFSESLRHYHELCIQPLVTLFQTALTAQLLPDEPGMRIEFDTSRLRVSRTDEVNHMVELVKAGILTGEEAKKELGYG